MGIDWLFKNLNQLINEGFDNFSESIIYLDAEQLYELYSSFTGLKGRPTVEIQQASGEIKASLLLAETGVTGGVSKSYEISDSHLLKIILPKLMEHYPEVNSGEMFKRHQKQRVWIEGELRNTIYIRPPLMSLEPYQGRVVFKPEFYFDDFKCDLMLIENYLSSLYRPIFMENKEFKETAKLLGHVHMCKETETGRKDEAIVSPIVILRI